MHALVSHRHGILQLCALDRGLFEGDVVIVVNGQVVQCQYPVQPT
jgi:hypothetical protein